VVVGAHMAERLAKVTAGNGRVIRVGRSSGFLRGAGRKEKMPGAAGDCVSNTLLSPEKTSTPERVSPWGRVWVFSSDHTLVNIPCSVLWLVLVVGVVVGCLLRCE
jgi:hypothetical protein